MLAGLGLMGFTNIHRMNGIKNWGAVCMTVVAAGILALGGVVNWPVALAIASSLLYIPLGSLAAWGEIGLAGEVRQVPFDTRRRQEAERVGLERIIAPSGRGSLRLASALIQAGLAGPVAGRT